MLVLNDFLNGLYDFLGFDRVLMDNILTTVIYLIYIYICIKSGANWITVLIGYLVLSTVFEFIGISSYLNIMTLLKTIFVGLIDIIFAPVERFLNNFLDALKSIFDILPW